MPRPRPSVNRTALGALVLAVGASVPVAAASLAQAADSPVFGQRISGADRYATAVAASREAFPDGAATVVLVGGEAVVDGLTASSVAGAVDAPILSVARDEVAQGTAEEVARLGAEDVVIVGGTAAVGAGVQVALESAGLTVTRLSGADRYATAAAVADRLVSDGRAPAAAFVASGDSPADALALAPIAYAQGYPILLTRTDEAPAPTTEALAAVGSGQRVVVGGTARVGEATATALGATSRLSGPDRSATAIAIADWAIASQAFAADRVALASGRDANAVDALTASPVAGDARTPILFTSGTTLGAGTTAWLREHAARLTGDGYVLGGTSAVPAAVVAQAAAAARPSGGTPTSDPDPSPTDEPTDEPTDAPTPEVSGSPSTAPTPVPGEPTDG